MIISICLFFYFVVNEYLSKKNKKLISLNRLNINQELIKQTNNLSVLKNDTDNVIEFNSGYNQDDKSKSQRKFWKLFNKNEFMI